MTRTYTTYSLRKAAVLIACGQDPLEVLDGDTPGKRIFVFDDTDGRAWQVIRQHQARELRLVTEDLFAAESRARGYAFGPRVA